MTSNSSQRWELRETVCSVCGSDDARMLGFRGGSYQRDGRGIETRIVQCRTCFLIFPNPMPHPAGKDERYAHVSGYFEETMNVEGEERRAFGDYLARSAKRLLGAPGRWLDVGCGRGEIVRATSQRGWDASGCDISEAFSRYAREMEGVDVRTGTLEELHYPAASFDVVSLVEVIEHLYDPGTTARELHRIVRPGGLVYISTPNEESIYQTIGNAYYRLRSLDAVVNLCPTWNLYHVHGFSPRSLQYLLEHTGFRIEELVLYPGTFPLPHHGGFWGRLERLGVRLVEGLAKITSRSPYMYAWARKVEACAISIRA